MRRDGKSPGLQAGKTRPQNRGLQPRVPPHDGQSPLSQGATSQLAAKPHLVSGHGFGRAVKDRCEAPSLLPQAVRAARNARSGPTRRRPNPRAVLHPTPYTLPPRISCQPPHLFTKVTDAHNKPLTRQTTPTKLA